MMDVVRVHVTKLCAFVYLCPCAPTTTKGVMASKKKKHSNMYFFVTPIGCHTGSSYPTQNYLPRVPNPPRPHGYFQPGV